MDQSDFNFWNTKYKQQEGTLFDWLENYETLREFIKVTPESHVLILGCGTSTLAEEMHDRDISRLLCILYRNFGKA